MAKHYYVSVDDSEKIKVTEKDIDHTDIIPLNHSGFHAIKDSKTYHASIMSSDFNTKSYQVKINKNVFNVNIFSDLDILIKDMGFEVGSSRMINDIKAPMPGLLLDINVSEGQEVKENETLLILEAMKMENVLTSPRDGVIKSIAVKKGDAVEKNQLLLTFE